MQLGQNASKEAPADDEGYTGQQAKDDQYVPIAVSVLPESVTLATLNEQNRRYWKNAGGEQS